MKVAGYARTVIQFAVLRSTCESSYLWDDVCPTLITCTCRYKKIGIWMHILSSGPTFCNRRSEQRLNLFETMQQEKNGRAFNYNIPRVHEVIQFAVNDCTCESPNLRDYVFPTLITCTWTSKHIGNQWHIFSSCPTLCGSQIQQCWSIIETMQQEHSGRVCKYNNTICSEAKYLWIIVSLGLCLPDSYYLHM